MSRVSEPHFCWCEMNEKEFERLYNFLQRKIDKSLVHHFVKSGYSHGHRAMYFVFDHGTNTGKKERKVVFVGPDSDGKTILNLMYKLDCLRLYTGREEKDSFEYIKHDIQDKERDFYANYHRSKVLAKLRKSMGV